jgi:hypothetical protein
MMESIKNMNQNLTKSLHLLYVFFAANRIHLPHGSTSGLGGVIFPRGRASKALRIAAIEKCDWTFARCSVNQIETADHRATRARHRATLTPEVVYEPGRLISAAAKGFV